MSEEEYFEITLSDKKPTEELVPLIDGILVDVSRENDKEIPTKAYFPTSSFTEETAKERAKFLELDTTKAPEPLARPQTTFDDVSIRGVFKEWVQDVKETKDSIREVIMGIRKIIT